MITIEADLRSYGPRCVIGNCGVRDLDNGSKLAACRLKIHMLLLLCAVKIDDQTRDTWGWWVDMDMWDGVHT
jgi:hypothetical protein